MAFIVGDFVCTVMILVALAMLLFALLLPKIAEHRMGKRGNEGLIIVVMVLLIVSLTGYTTWLYYDYQEWIEAQEAEYSLNITVDGDVVGVVYVPVCKNKELREALQVTSPNGTMSIVETERGTALRVEFRGNLTVRGRVESTESIGDIELTMLDGGHLPVSHYYWFRFDGDGPENSTVSIDLMLEYHSIYLDEWYWTSQELDGGWSSNKVRYEYQEWYYG